MSYEVQSEFLLFSDAWSFLPHLLTELLLQPSLRVLLPFLSLKQRVSANVCYVRVSRGLIFRVIFIFRLLAHLFWVFIFLFFFRLLYILNFIVFTLLFWLFVPLFFTHLLRVRFSDLYYSLNISIESVSFSTTISFRVDTPIGTFCFSLALFQRYLVKLIARLYFIHLVLLPCLFHVFFHLKVSWIFMNMFFYPSSSGKQSWQIWHCQERVIGHHRRCIFTSKSLLVNTQHQLLQRMYPGNSARRRCSTSFCCNLTACILVKSDRSQGVDQNQQATRHGSENKPVQSIRYCTHLTYIWLLLQNQANTTNTSRTMTFTIPVRLGNETTVS